MITRFEWGISTVHTLEFHIYDSSLPTGQTLSGVINRPVPHNNIGGGGAWRMVAIMMAYENPYVACNMAQNYLNYYNITHKSKFTNFIRGTINISNPSWLSRYFPQLKYNEKYHNCFMNHFSRKIFTLPP